MIICMVIFAATLVSYMLNKIPMWLTAMISLAALYFTGCIDASGALAGFSNVNTLLMATMFVVAAGFRRTSLVDGMFAPSATKKHPFAFNCFASSRSSSF